MVRKIEPDADSGRGSPSSPPNRHQRHQRHQRQRRRGQGDALHPKRLAAAAAAAVAAGEHPSPVSADISRLLKLILVQGETIQSQLRRLRDREDEILGLEHATHQERQQQLGSNYLLETYLRDLDCEKDDSGVMTSSPVEEDEPANQPPEPSSPDVAEAIELLERLVKLNKRLEREEEMLVRLSAKLRRCRDGDPVAELKSQLVEVDAALEAGAQEASEAERRLLESEALLRERLETLERLQAEVDAAEAETCECIPPPEEFQSPPTHEQSHPPAETTENSPKDITARVLSVHVPNDEPPSSSSPLSSASKPNDCSYTYYYPNPSPFPLYFSHGAPPKPQRHPSMVDASAVASAVQKPPDTDSNSDTGLSSLHSSSEEGVYVLDTLV